MRYVIAAAMLTTLISPALAQFSGGGEAKTPLQLKYEKEEQEQKENERQYNVQMKRLKAQAPVPTSNDPWRKVRSSSEGKGSADAGKK
jgi:hypothetical protein